MADADPRALVRQMLEHTETLPASLRSDILARGPEVVEPLVEVLLDESLALITAPGEGYAPIHAVELLAQLKAPEAIAPMVRRLMHTEPGDLLYDSLLYALEAFGPSVAPAALEALASARDERERFGLLCALSHSGARDERIYAALLAQLQEDTIVAAMNLSTYGDARAIEPLTREFDAYPVNEDEEDLFANQAVIELQDAIEQLGGTLDAAQLEKVAQARRSRHRLSSLFQGVLDTLPPPPVTQAPRPGRNEPCWCGSGVKYKKCHLGADRRQPGPGS
jgi:hypothetical protein